MGQQSSKEEEAAPQSEEEEKGSGLFGWLFSPNAGDKRTRDHVDKAEQGLPVTKKTKTEETMTINGVVCSIPKPPFSSYIAFSIDRRREMQRKYPNVESVEISKMLGEEWRGSAELRQEYKDRQDKAKAEYEAKMTELGLPLTLPRRKQRTPKQKKEGKRVDDGRPKRPLSAYNLFKRERRPMIRKENPEVTTQEITALLAQQWKELSEDLRGKYMVDYGESLEAYHVEMAKWRATQGQKK